MMMMMIIMIIIMMIMMMMSYMLKNIYCTRWKHFGDAPWCYFDRVGSPGVWFFFRPGTEFQFPATTSAVSHGWLQAGLAWLGSA
jgi:hypothetical protein